MNARFALSILALAINSTAVADDCLGVIEASRQVSSTTSSEDEFVSSATLFCSEYFKNTADRNEKNIGIGYEFLSFRYGDQSSSIEKMAAKTCDSRENNKVRKSAYSATS